MTGFNTIAYSYDTDFTRSRTGIMQREVVRRYLERYIDDSAPLNILELGCGTGEDALYLARKGHRVLATDISEKMIEVARKKAAREKLNGSTDFQVMDMRTLRKEGITGSFDLVFSNFGALNCLNDKEFKALCESLGSLLVEGGRFIGVVMPRFCTWESLYFLAKGRWTLIFRRKKRDGVPAQLGASEILTWYYSPHLVRKLSGDQYDTHRIRPVGFFLPPSYLDPYFQDKKRLLNLLAGMERWVAGSSLPAMMSDHFIFELKRKK